MSAQLNEQRDSAVYRSRLDQDRAASMADEGGVSGAYTEARERGEKLPVARARRWQGPSWLPWALALAGAFILGRLARR